MTTKIKGIVGLVFLLSIVSAAIIVSIKAGAGLMILVGLTCILSSLAMCVAVIWLIEWYATW